MKKHTLYCSYISESRNLSLSVEMSYDKTFIDVNFYRYLELITLGFWLSPAVSTPDPIIMPESVSSRADNCRGLILRSMTKVPCYNLFITYSKPFFQNNFD